MSRFVCFFRLCLLTLGLFSVSLPAFADCNRHCSGPRDANGCCVAAPASPKPNAPAKAAPAECTDGRRITPDTNGHCCWEGQVWSGGRCVGVPVACPPGFNVVEATQECVVPACAAGRVRMPDGFHCCFPRQAWSSTRAICVGIPACPDGFEQNGESCVSKDLDGDGIYNQSDSCPEEAEDRNGFEDADGCPDEARRREVMRERALAEQRAAEEEAEQQRKLEEQHQQEIAEQQRREAEAQRRRDEAARLEQQRRKQHDDQVALAASKRRTAWGLIIAGGVLEATAATFAGLGSLQNDSIRSGGLASSSDIEDAAAVGQTYNAVAYGTLALGGVALVWGGVKLLINPDPPPYSSESARRTLPPRLGFTF